jgi:hypothetical protein
VVTALCVAGDRVIAGTDDGGLVWVSAGGVRALRFAEPRANQVNPGALACDGGVAWAGTQGAGLVRVAADGTRADRPASLVAAEISSVVRDSDGLLIGTAAGEVYFVRL